ncbi:MAG: hypothetical protein ACR2RB_22895 [Gammaproteobacteria bacterium]
MAMSTLSANQQNNRISNRTGIHYPLLHLRQRGDQGKEGLKMPSRHFPDTAMAKPYSAIARKINDLRSPISYGASLAGAGNSDKSPFPQLIDPLSLPDRWEQCKGELRRALRSRATLNEDACRRTSVRALLLPHRLANSSDTQTKRVQYEH